MLGACAMLIALSQNATMLVATIIYSLSQAALFGISALYHRHNWGPIGRARMRRMDHSAIFISIAGTCTPICMLAIPDAGGMQLLSIIWATATAGVLQSVFWWKAPKWLAAILYVGMGWMAFPYLPEINAALGPLSVVFLLTGGVIYTLGAVVYATKKPNPWPVYFGYHEIFHIMVIIAAMFHFAVIAKIVLRFQTGV